VGQSVRPTLGTPIHATRGPTSRRSRVGRRLPRLRQFPCGTRGFQVSNRGRFSRLTRVPAEPRGRGGDSFYRMPGRQPSPRPGCEPWRSDRMDGLRGQRRLTGVGPSDVGPQGGIGIRPDEQGALPRVIRKRPAWGISVAYAPFGTVDTTRPPTILRSTTKTPEGTALPIPSLLTPPWSTAARRRPTPPVTGPTKGALRRRLLVVDVAVAVMLLAAVGPTGGHADFAKENRAGGTPTHNLKQVPRVARPRPGVVAGPLSNRVAKRDHCVPQAGYQGPRGVAAEFQGVVSHHARQPLRDAIREDVIELVESHVADVTVLHGVVGSNVYRISDASHCTSAAFCRSSHFRKLRTTGLQMSSYMSPDA